MFYIPFTCIVILSDTALNVMDLLKVSCVMLFVQDDRINYWGGCPTLNFHPKFCFKFCLHNEFITIQLKICKIAQNWTDTEIFHRFFFFLRILSCLYILLSVIKNNMLKTERSILNIGKPKGIYIFWFCVMNLEGLCQRTEHKKIKIIEIYSEKQSCRLLGFHAQYLQQECGDT